MRVEDKFNQLRVSCGNGRIEATRHGYVSRASPHVSDRTAALKRMPGPTYLHTFTQVKEGNIAKGGLGQCGEYIVTSVI